jgi:hypothetical protein
LIPLNTNARREGLYLRDNVCGAGVWLGLHRRNDAKRADVVAAVLILRFGRVRSPASSTGAARNSWRPERSPTRISPWNSIPARGPVTMSGIVTLWELPTTQRTPGIAANSSGARCA